jgi:hypothetical protein
MDARGPRRLVSSAYLVAFTMAAVAVADMFARVLPARPGDITWRIGVVGIVSLSVPTLLLALLVTFLTAWYLDHRVLLRVLAVLSLASAVVMVGVLPFFGLDLLELRGLVAAEGQASFDLAMGRAALTILGAAATTGWMGYAGWRAGRPRRRETHGSAGTKRAAKEQAAAVIGQGVERAPAAGRGRAEVTAGPGR